jgi:SnoaL-like domain
MSRENVEIVRRIYDEFARPEAIRELYHPDFEMDAVDAAPDVGVIRGFDAMVEALRSYFEMFEDLHLELSRQESSPRSRRAAGKRRRLQTGDGASSLTARGSRSR